MKDQIRSASDLAEAKPPLVDYFTVLAYRFLLSVLLRIALQ
ncbi:hypothetical protein [Emticicia sp. BO119]|nr:hypothetical protein [Emticicia sp. BO119]